MVLDGKPSQEYSVNAGLPQGSILGPTPFLLYIHDLPDDVLCNINTYADDTTLYSKCDQASDLWQQQNDKRAISIQMIDKLECFRAESNSW